MDLLNLAAKITLDDSSYKNGIKNAESMGEQLKGKMSAWTVAVGNLAADMVKKGIAAVGNVVNGAIDGYADYQQLIGGVETLFKGSADKVAAYAKQSFRTTGLSANDYMETVTSFSASLLQGLGGDTEAAAELANTAVTDMADNANKMGTDISMIQSAYQGFAKQNYTMLDNLKLGYGGTQGEMVRLINDSKILDHEIENLDDITFDQMIAAIHKVQEEMGITGTTAKEAAETISGSKASLKAAWEDLLTAVGGGMTNEELDEKMGNFKESFNDYMNNFLPTLVSTIAGSGNLVTAIAGAISDLPKDLLSQVAEAGLESGTQMVGAVSNITSWIIENIANMFKSAKTDPSQVADFGAALGDFLGSTIKDLITYAPDILTGIISVGVNLAGGLIEGLFQGLFGEDSELRQIDKEFQKTVSDTEKQATKASAILTYMESLKEKYGEAVKETNEWKKAEADLETVLGGSKSVFESYGDDVQGAIDKLKEMSEQLRRLAIQQALQEKMEAQYALLGEKSTELYESQVRQGYAEQAAAGMATPEAMIKNIQAYATELERIGEIMGLDADVIKEYTDISKKGVLAGPFGETNLSDLPMDELKYWLESLAGTLEGYYEGGIYDKEGNEVNIPEYERIWNRDHNDEIFSLEEMQSAQQTIKEETENQAAIQEEIARISQQIMQTEQAAERAMNEFGSATSDGASSVKSGGDNIADALNDAAGKIRVIDFSTGGGGGNEPEAAIGINDVPWDGYRAKLHKGEAVLSRSEADKWRHGSSSADMAEMVADAVRDTLSHLYLNMDGKRVADGTTRRTEKNISANSYARVRSMGG